MTELEPGRPEPGFSVHITRPISEAVSSHYEGDDLARALQDVYDIAINSMDFGSGFLSTEEVHNLRLLGRAIGAEPFHYQCGHRAAYVVERRYQASPKYPIGSTVPAVPCTCGFEEFT